jgi:hypothetical protein
MVGWRLTGHQFLEKNHGPAAFSPWKRLRRKRFVLLSTNGSVLSTRRRRRGDATAADGHASSLQRSRRPRAKGATFEAAPSMSSVSVHPLPGARHLPLMAGLTLPRLRAVADAVVEMAAGLVLLGAFVGAMW